MSDPRRDDLPVGNRWCRWRAAQLRHDGLEESAQEWERRATAGVTPPDPAFPWPSGYTRESALARVRLDGGMRDLPDDASDAWISGSLSVILDRDARAAAERAKSERADAIDDTPTADDVAHATQNLSSMRAAYPSEAAFERAVDHRARDAAWHRNYGARLDEQRRADSYAASARRDAAVDQRELEERRAAYGRRGMEPFPNAARGGR
jgi:hypothetical protein